MALVRKPEADQMKVPKDMMHMFVDLGRARGKLTTCNMLKMQVKSKLDRLLAAKS